MGPEPRSAGGDWNGNLDALNDYLSWPSEAVYELKLLDSAQCAVALDHGAMAAWLKHKLITCHPSNIPQVQADLAMAERAQGETLFGLICEIIAAKAHVRLILS